MKKKFIVLFLIVVCINNVSNKEVLQGFGKFEPEESFSSIALNDQDDSYCISTSNEKSVVVARFTFVTDDDENSVYPKNNIASLVIGRRKF